MDSQREDNQPAGDHVERADAIASDDAFDFGNRRRNLPEHPGVGRLAEEAEPLDASDCGQIRQARIAQEKFHTALRVKYSEHAR